MQKKSLISSMKTTKRVNVAAAWLTVMLIGCPLLRAQAPHRMEPESPRRAYSNKIRKETPPSSSKVNKETPPDSLNLDPRHPKPQDDSPKYEKYEKPEPQGGAGIVGFVVVLVVALGFCGLVSALTGLGKWLFENWAPQK